MVTTRFIIIKIVSPLNNNFSCVQRGIITSHSFFYFSISKCQIIRMLL